ncbi:MAG TPA: translocation/assembly module TamB domain-containing protein [Thermoanaerobaculia bacterium]|nr:translocation/assembly module TamB domain-containing protein [Thermoanaerobaculia bacterium]
MSEPAPRPVRPRRRRLRRLRRIAGISLLVVLALPILIALGVLAALQAGAVRRAVLGRLSTVLRESYGLAATAEDFSPLWAKRGIELHRVRLGAPGAAPLATAERVEAVVDLGTLRSRPLVLRAVTAEGVVVDLSAPLPKMPESPPEAGVGPALEIQAITLRRGEVRGAPLARPAADWVRSWSAREIAARGSFRGGRLDLEVEQAKAILDRPGFGRQELQVTARVGYEDKKPLAIDGLRVTGDGLRLAASGTLGLEPGAPTAANFDLDAEPRALAAGAPPRGRIRANGNLALPANTGQVKLIAEEIPAEALRPWLDPKLYGDLALAGTLVDLKGDATIGPGEWTRVAGTAQGGWRRGNLRLAQAEVKLTPGVPLAATVAADLLPGSPGRRSLQGTLRAASWAEMAKATAEGVRAQVALPDVAAALAEARSLWPRLVPPPPPGVPIQGSLTADVHASGDLASPTATMDATWVPREGSLVNLKGQGKPRTWTGSATVRMEALPLELAAAFAPGLSGTVTGTAELAGSPKGYRTKVTAETASLAFPPSLETLASGTVGAEGTVVLKPFSYRGTLSVDGAGLVAQASASATARIERFQLAADGLLSGQPLSWDGTLSLDGTGVEVPGTARVDHLKVATQGKTGLDPQSFPKSLAAKVRIDADRLLLTGSATEIRNLHAEAEGDAREVRLAAFSGELPAGQGGKFAGSGRATLDPLFAEADLDLHLTQPLAALRAVDLTARLREGAVEVSAPRLDTASGLASLWARVPLGALRQVPQLAPALDGFPRKLASGPVSVSLEAAALDSQPLLAALGQPPRPEWVRAGVSAELTLDLSARSPLTASRGEIQLSGLSLETPDGRVAAQGRTVLRLAEGRLELLPVHLAADLSQGGTPEAAGVDLRASAQLSPSWRPGDPPAAAVTRLAAEGNGTLAAALLNPLLQGGEASGSLTFSGRVAGPLEHLTGEAEASGPGAAIVFPSPPLRITDPQVSLALADGRFTLRQGKLGVNGGTVNLVAGSWSAERGLDADVHLVGVRYRLDVTPGAGVDTQLSGRLKFTAPPGEQMRLAGRVVVDRGLLDRDLNLDREAFTLLLKPRATPSTAGSALSAIDLDLTIETTEGVRVKNNVGDLHTTWRQLTLQGTLDNPVIRGRIDIDPDGRVFAYGQTVRIDSGSLTFTGDPATDPKIDLKTTTSLQDPTIAQLKGEGPLDLLVKPPVDDTTAAAQDAGSALLEGIANYYGTGLLQKLTESAGGLGGFTVRPVLVFNEADPSARLTVGRDLSRNVSLAVSVDLRNAERQTYLFYVQDLTALPGLRVEGFTNDVGHHGGSLQQAFSFGAGGDLERVSKDRAPRLRRLDVSTPKGGVSKREVKGAVRLQKGGPVPEGAAFGAEVDVAALLRRKGYPDPRITVEVTPVESRPGWVDVAVTVEPGPKVSFVFAGDKPPFGLRPEITGLYRTDFYEAGSIEEMRKAAVRAFRTAGYLGPQVEIEVKGAPGEEGEQPDPSNRVPLSRGGGGGGRERGRGEGLGWGDAPRTVTIHTQAGRRQALGTLAIAGLDAESARLAAASFPGALARAELAAGLPDADARLLKALKDLGYPAARIAGRSLEKKGVVVTVEPGPRQTVAAVRVAGVPAEESERLLALVPLHPGDPVRLDLAVSGAQLMGDDLRKGGFADAKVRALEAAAPDAPAQPDRLGSLELTYEVTPGLNYRLAALDLQGEHWSKPAPLLRASGLKVGEPLSEARLEEARTRLLRTGVFSRVDAEVKKEEDGEARVTLGLTERPRFRFGYGVRWESGVGTGAVLDFVDQNFLGRAITLGLRGLYQTGDESGRLYLRTGGVLGTPISFEGYAEARRLNTPGDDNLLEDRREVALEALRPFGKSDTAHLYLRYRTTHIFEVHPDPFFPFDLTIRLPIAGFQFLRDTRDDRIDPRRGLFASLDLSGSGTFLGSDFEYARLFAQVASFRGLRLAGRAWTWGQSVRLGVAHPFGGQDVIRDELFFAGGPFSVRGYRMDSLGPQEVLGDVVQTTGGEALFVLNEELRFALPFSLTGLAFFDAGQVWAHPHDLSFDLAKSIGLGLRASTPVGLLRLDAAYPLDRRPGDGRYKLYFGFGNAF